MTQKPAGKAVGFTAWLKRPSFTDIFNAPALSQVSSRIPAQISAQIPARILAWVPARAHKPATLAASFILAAAATMGGHALLSSAQADSNSVFLNDGSRIDVALATRLYPSQFDTTQRAITPHVNLAADLGLGLRDDSITIDGEQASDAEHREHVAALLKLATLAKPARNDILQIQSLLNTMDYGAGREDGIFGANTSGAFARFLKDRSEGQAKQTASVSPWILERLAYNGVRNPLAATQGQGKLAFDTAANAHSGLTPLPRAQVKEMQEILKAQGYLSTRADGDFGFRTAGALMGYLQDNQNDITLLSPWLLQQLMKHGHQKTLADTLHDNPALWGKFSERLRRETASMNNASAQSVMSAQALLRASGIYNGRVDGVAGPGTQAALEELDYYFHTADITNLRRGTTQTLPARQVGNDYTQPVLSIADASQLAANAGFRAALSRGDYARVNRYLDALDTTPLHLEHPVEGHRVSSRYGPRYVAGIDRRVRMHQGTDFSARTGTPIDAAHGGRVVLAGTHGHYGRSVLIDHGHNIMTHYAHMSRVAVKPGDVIQPGQSIGAVGATGRVKGSHLHFEVILRDRDGTPVVINAEKFMGRNLRDPQIHLAAIADARLTARNQGWKESRVTSRFTERRAPENGSAVAGLTPNNAKILLDVLAADRTLLASVPRTVLAGLRDAGYRDELNQLANANGTVRTIALNR